jgi:hypothetical protein
VFTKPIKIMKLNTLKFFLLFTAGTILVSCDKEKDKEQTPSPAGKDPNTAEVASVDRFSAAAGMLQVRSATNGLPGPNQPVDFDKEPFITRGLTPAGKSVDYYNFDVQPIAPAPIWALFKKDGTPVQGQLNIINVIPGDAGYNDFWQVHKVTVPDDYVANTITNYTDLAAKGYTIEKTNLIVNCPVVPKGSTATKRFTNEDAGLTRGWYKDKVVFYFNFSEKGLMATGAGNVPVSPIYVTFNINPGQTGGGPESGFRAEPGTMPAQTHNVVATVPADAAYSPLWSVNVYDNANFANVSNLSTASSATILATGVATVNCPVVYIMP